MAEKKQEAKKVETFAAVQHTARKVVGQPASEKTPGDLIREKNAKKKA